MVTEETIFASQLPALLKERGKKVDTSETIIGHDEHGEITPSIRVAQKRADVFRFTLGYLVPDKEVPNILPVKMMLELGSPPSIPGDWLNTRGFYHGYRT